MTPPKHVLHVGFPKAGATFFKLWCDSREDVAFCRGGMAGVAGVVGLAGETGPRPALRVTSCEALLTRMPASISGERRTRLRTSIGHYVDGAEIARQQERTARDLHALFPSAHVLILVRGYDTACRSYLTEGVKKGRLWAARDEPAFLRMAASLLHYDRVVAYYEATFGAGQVTVLPYELLRDSAPAFVGALCAVGGIPYRPFDPSPVNVSPPPHALGLLATVSARAHAGIERLPLAARDRARDRYQRVLERLHSRPALDRLARGLRVAPIDEGLFAVDVLRAAFEGRAEAVARRPEVAPYAAHYMLGPAPPQP